MSSGQELATMRRYANAIRLHLVGVVSRHASEREPLERLIETWEGDLKGGFRAVRGSRPSNWPLRA